ncbi:MAG: SO_0444 family Cu/Zn efflux transporter [Candidatus Eiseniibacteriota bacterium]
MIDFLGRFLRELVLVFLEASPYILLGFVVAAAIQTLVPVAFIQRLLGRGRFRSIFTGSLLGLPLPLCSCSVLPTAMALRRRGASRGATVSFLVSTPETGEEAIALTWGLMGPLMAIYRPIAALVSGIAAGFATELFGGPEEKVKPEAAQPTAAEPPACDDCPPDTHGHTHDALAAAERKAGGESSMAAKLRAGFREAFVEMFDETSHWMFAGLVISALITLLLPADIVTRYLGAGPLPYVVMLAIGIPLYICASASTPIAAALIVKGLSPGAALVFLLAGPATNIGSLAILSRFLGRRVTIIYLVTIGVTSVVLGVLLDVAYRTFAIDPRAVAGGVSHLPLWISVPASVAFALLLVFSFLRAPAPVEFRAVGRALSSLTGFRPSRATLAGAAVVALVLWAASTCLLIVPPGHRGLVQRFGAPRGEPRGEGLHLKLPVPLEVAELVHVDGVRRLELGFRSSGAGPDTLAAPVTPDAPRLLEEESLFLTGDENLVDAKSVVQYRILDAARWRWGFVDPEAVLRSETIAEIVDVVAALSIDHVYGDLRRTVEQRVGEGLRRRVDALPLGVEVLRFGVLDLHAPPEVHAAFRDVASSQEDKRTAIDVARRYLVETVNLARGDAVAQVEAAKSFATAEVFRAQGESTSLALRSDAYRARRTGARTRLYLETVEEVLAGSRKIVRPGWGGSAGVDLWISTGAGDPEAIGDVIRGSEVREAAPDEGEGE